MNIQIISGSARLHSMTKRVALHLYNRLAENPSLNVGFIDMQDHHLLPVEQVWSNVESVPKHLQKVASAVFNADAFILVSPEYNGSYSPALKNFLDHFPKQERKVFGIVTASAGSLGGVRAALQLQTLIFGLSGIGSPRMLIVPALDTKFADDGELLDTSFDHNIESFVNELLWLCGAVTNAKVAGAVETVIRTERVHMQLTSGHRNGFKLNHKAISLAVGVALAFGLGFSHPLSDRDTSQQEVINKMMPALIKNHFYKTETQSHRKQQQTISYENY